MTANDNGRTLAARLIEDRLVEVERVVNQVRRAFDHDEDAGGSYGVIHSDLCPAYHKPGGDAKDCACGLSSMYENLRDACNELASIRAQAKRLGAE